SQIFCSVADTKDIELSNLPKFGLTNLNLVKSSTPNQTITDPADPVYPISSNRYEKMERIKKGPFQPLAIIFPRRKLVASERNFYDNWYSQFNWLEYSPCLDAAFCFPCRCFAREISSKRGHADKAYTKTGFRGWNIATTKFKAHQITYIHISSVNILSEYLKANPIDGILVKEKQLEISRQEEQRIANRTIMKRLIDIIITLTKGGRALRRHNEKNDNMGHHEQMSIVVRYFDDDTFNPVERFVGLQRLKLVDSQSIFNELSMVLKNLKIQWRDVVSVCFDGASTMSGCISGVQAKCKEVNSSIMYVHCYAHCLNLILVDACTSRKENRIVFDFFGVVQLTYSFIEGSAIRHAVLERISADINASLKSMKSLSTTRWACRSEAVSALKHNYLAILLALEEIVDRTKQPDVRAKGRGLLFQLKTFQFILGLEMMDPILQIINKFQAQSLEEELRVQSFFPMLDIMISGIDERFNQDAINLINAVDGLMKLKICITDINLLSNHFKCNKDELVAEINLLQKNETITRQIEGNLSAKMLHIWLQWLKNYDKQNIFGQFTNILKKFSVIPVTSCTCERSFSKLTLVKSKLRSTMLQERLNALMLITVEQEMAINLNLDDVIDHFKNSTQRRMVL
ncbi:zinc finger MYM-type protein 1-like, partial [Aphis craccivora]